MRQAIKKNAIHFTIIKKKEEERSRHCRLIVFNVYNADEHIVFGLISERVRPGAIGLTNKCSNLRKRDFLRFFRRFF